jgi:hypothetical protein
MFRPPTLSLGRQCQGYRNVCSTFLACSPNDGTTGCRCQPATRRPVTDQERDELRAHGEVDEDKAVEKHHVVRAVRATSTDKGRWQQKQQQQHQVKMTP